MNELLTDGEHVQLEQHNGSTEERRGRGAARALRLTTSADTRACAVSRTAAAHKVVVHHVVAPRGRPVVMIDVHETRGIVDVVMDVGVAAAAGSPPPAAAGC